MNEKNLKNTTVEISWEISCSNRETEILGRSGSFTFFSTTKVPSISNYYCLSLCHRLTITPGNNRLQISAKMLLAMFSLVANTAGKRAF